MGLVLDRVVSGKRPLIMDGQWAARLNQAMTIHPSLRLLARLHGQCEIHCYVEGVDRAWFADRIYDALHVVVRTHDDREDMELLRVGHSCDQGQDIGWLKLMDWLRSRDDEPVVCSYSVTDQFPRWDEGADDTMTWPKAMDWLRTQGGLRMSPEDWDSFYFAVPQ